MPASAFLEKEILEVYLKEAAATKPKKLWIAFCEEEPKRDATSETIKEAGKGLECAYTGYARKEINVEAASTIFEFKEGAAAELSKALNVAAIAYALNSGLDEKDKAVWWAILDKAKNTEAGKMYFYGKWEKELKVQPTLTKVESEAKKFEITVE